MDLRKRGKQVLLVTLIVIVLLNFMPLHYTFRLFVGSFGFGSGIALMAIGSSKKYDL